MNNVIRCTFCDAGQHECKVIIWGISTNKDNIYMCDKCVSDAVDGVAKKLKEKREKEEKPFRLVAI